MSDNAGSASPCPSDRGCRERPRDLWRIRRLRGAWPRAGPLLLRPDHPCRAGDRPGDQRRCGGHRNRDVRERRDHQFGRLTEREVFTTSTGIRFVTFVTVEDRHGLLRETKSNPARRAAAPRRSRRPHRAAEHAGLRARDRRTARSRAALRAHRRLCRRASRRGATPTNMLRQVASRLLHSLPPGDEVARIGDDSFAVLTYAGSAGDAGKNATHLQALLAADGFAVTFGWAAYPQDGSNRAVALPGRRRATVRATHRSPSHDGGRAETLGDLSVTRRRAARARTSLRRRAPRDLPRRRRGRLAALRPRSSAASRLRRTAGRPRARSECAGARRPRRANPSSPRARGPRADRPGGEHGVQQLFLDVEPELDVRGATRQGRGTAAQAGQQRRSSTDATGRRTRAAARRSCRRRSARPARRRPAPRTPWRRAEQKERLVDEVATEVVEESTCVLRVTGLAPATRRARAASARSGTRSARPRPGRLLQQPADGQEVAVPAPVLEHGQHHAALTRVADQRAALARARSERLVDDHGEPGLDRRARERDVGAVRRRDDDEIEVADTLPDLLRRAEQRRVRMVAPGTGTPLLVVRDDRGELEPLDRSDQRRVEDSAGQAVAEQGDAKSAGSRSSVISGELTGGFDGETARRRGAMLVPWRGRGERPYPQMPGCATA